MPAGLPQARSLERVHTRPHVFITSVISARRFRPRRAAPRPTSTTRTPDPAMPDGEMPSSAAATRSPVPAALAKVPVAPPPHTHVAYETLLSDALRQWPDGSIRRLYSAEDMASGISFLTGMPNPSMFPFKWLAFGAVNPRSGETEAVTVRPDLFEASLQYLPAQGLAPLAEWFQQFVSTLHSRPIKSDDPAHTEWGVTVGSGIQDLLSTAFRVLLNPGDTVLFEAPTYPCVS